MRVPAVTASGAGLLASAVALRWSRPDLTAALAEHVGEVRAGDDRTWVAAAGWLVHGRAAIGDGRQCASDALAEIARRGQELLDDPAADRLRIEIATLAAGQCEPAVARSLVAPVLAADRSADVRADAYGVLARCVMEERPATIGEATRRAEIAWGEMGGVDADIASAALALISAAALRRSGHPDAAVDHAAEGLARLDEIRAAQEGAPSRHLAAALAAEWITALVEAGRTDDAREACAPMAQQLRKTARPTRQIALLRLAVARAVAESAPAAAVEALEQAAQDAAACDTPDLEGLCLSTLGALREQAGRLDAALESMRRGVAAQRRDRARSERFREALRSMSLAAPAARTEAVVAPLDRTERAVGKPARTHVPSTAVAAEETAVVSVHPLADARVVDPWSSGSWVDRSAGARAITRNGRRPRPGHATVSALGLAEIDVPLVTATGDNAARLGFDSGAGTRPGAGVVRGASSADEAGADGVASGSSPDVSAGGTDVAATSGRHAGGAGRDTASPIADSDASGPAVTQVNASESAGQAIDTAPDPLFGPIEHLAEVANPTARVDRPRGLQPRSGGIEDIPVLHEERPAHAPYDGERWLEAALAELDRVWGQPLPDLDEPLDPRVEPEAVAAVEPSAGRQASGESAEKGWAATSVAVEPLASSAASDGLAGTRPAATRPVAADASANPRAADGPADNGRAGLVSGAGSSPRISTAQPHVSGVAGPAEYNPVRSTDQRLADAHLDPPIYATNFRRRTPGPAAEDRAAQDPAAQNRAAQTETAGGFVIGDAAAARRAAHSHADDGRAARGIAAEDTAANDRAAQDRVAGLCAAGDPAEDRHADDLRAKYRRAAKAPAAEVLAVDDSAADPRVGEGGAAQGHAADDRVSGVDPVADSAGVDRAWPDLELVSPWADSRLAGKSFAVGRLDGWAAAADPVGCVVVVDVVRAGAAQSEVGGLLREVGDRVTRRIPPGARLRGEADGSALSVVLSGRERSVAIDWMHQTLPAVFAEVADLDTPSLWAKGTALRAAVHDTNGPVGAQLLQRLDLVAPQVDGGRARYDPPPPVVRWGVPILAGSGGRRRRPDAGHSTAVPGDDRPNSRQTDETARPETAPAEVAHGQTAPAAGDRAEADGVAAPVSANSQKQTSDEEESEFSVEGLGLADLLAGALAAYRGI